MFNKTETPKNPLTEVFVVYVQIGPAMCEKTSDLIVFASEQMAHWVADEINRLADDVYREWADGDREFDIARSKEIYKPTMDLLNHIKTFEPFINLEYGVLKEISFDADRVKVRKLPFSKVGVHL